MPIVICTECSESFSKPPSQMRSAKGNNFCSRTCSVSYNNKHKDIGERRSKFELYIEERLKELYPGLKIDFNKKNAIGSELDLFISELNLAFEIQGITHYKAIWNEEILKNKQKMDQEKRNACKAIGIELVEIDISEIKDFKRSLKFVSAVETILDKIKNIYESKKFNRSKIQ